MFREILNTFWTKIASAIIAFCILILTTQYLGAEGRGVVSLISSSIGIIGIFVGFVGGPAVIYFAARNKSQNLFVPIYGWAVIVTIMGSGILLLFHITPATYIFPIAILSFISSVYIANFYMLVGHQKVRINNFIYFFQWVVNLIALVIFFVVLNQSTVEFVVIAMFIAGVCGLGLTLLELKKVTAPMPVDWSHQINVMKSLVSFSFFAQAAAVMCYLNYRLGIFVLPNFSGLSATGIYSVGVNLAELILLASQSIALVAYSRISNTNDREYAKDITIKLAKVGFLSTLGLTMFLLFLPSVVYSIVFGSDFSSVPSVLFAMSPGIIAFGTSIIIFNYFAGIGKNQVNAIAAFVGLGANILFCYLLIPVFGSVGAGITASISFILMSGILIWAFSKETNTSFKEFIIRKTDIEYIYTKFRGMILPAKE
jgi:O-antigen/teichoic acid export membrane protein